MDNFLEKYKLARLNQEEIRYLNQLRMIKQTKFVGKYFTPQKGQVAKDGFTGLFYQKFKEQIATVLVKCLRE